MDIKEISQYNVLSLAYLGDAIWDSCVRQYYFFENLKVDEFNNKVRNFVNAKMQSKIYKEIFAELDKELQDISKRGRNTKIKSFAKSCSPTEYRNATAFEVLIGTLHLLGNEEKIKEILKNFIEGEKNNEEKK